MLNKNYEMIFDFNPMLFKTVLETLKPQKTEKILEIGCGRGYYLNKLERYVKEVVGVDTSEAAISNAVSMKVKYGDATRLDFQESAFDKIYSLHTVEHIPDADKFFFEISRALKPKGIAVIVYPWEPIRGMQVFARSLILYRNIFKAQEIHLHNFNPKKVEKIAGPFGMKHLKSKLLVWGGIQYLTVLQKEG